MTGDIGMHPDHKAEPRTSPSQQAWIPPLSCVTETDIRATGPNSDPGTDAPGATSTHS